METDGNWWNMLEWYCGHWIIVNIKEYDGIWEACSRLEVEKALVKVYVLFWLRCDHLYLYIYIYICKISIYIYLHTFVCPLYPHYVPMSVAFIPHLFPGGCLTAGSDYGWRSLRRRNSEGRTDLDGKIMLWPEIPVISTKKPHLWNV